MVRSHYPDKIVNADRMYRAGNALGEWLNLNGWVGIAIMQEPANKENFAQMIADAK